MDANENLETQINQLNGQLESLNGHWFLRANRSWRKVVLSQFVRGLAFGFGSVIGATIVVSIAGYVLSQLEVVPIIGEWATEIGREIVRSTNQP